jgi:hypothetical protein
MIPGAQENKRMQHPLTVQAIHHYTAITKLGYSTGVKCWCGAVLEFRYHESGMKSKRIAFFAEHDECVPSSEISTSLRKVSVTTNDD